MIHSAQCNNDARLSDEIMISSKQERRGGRGGGRCNYEDKCFSTIQQRLPQLMLGCAHIYHTSYLGRYRQTKKGAHRRFLNLVKSEQYFICFSLLAGCKLHNAMPHPSWHPMSLPAPYLYALLAHINRAYKQR